MISRSRPSRSGCELGDWLAVPLPGGGYGLCMVARSDGKYSALGYFFGPRFDSVPDRNATLGLSPESAVLIRLFSLLGVVEGAWSRITHADDWDPSHWPMPAFARIDDKAGKAWVVEYDDYCRVIGEHPVSIEVARTLPSDGLSGYEAAAIRLEQVLSKLVE